MARKEDNRLEIRISSEEKERLKAIAEEQNKPVAEVVKEAVRKIPNPKNSKEGKL
jgi:predicted DNA-binding protein